MKVRKDVNLSEKLKLTIGNKAWRIEECNRTPCQPLERSQSEKYDFQLWSDGGGEVQLRADVRVSNSH